MDIQTTVEVCGNIYFDPKDYTKKHKRQSNWKKVAIVDIKGDWCSYYSWFLEKRGLRLNVPLRRSHITFVNDRFNRISGNTNEDKEILWRDVKEKFQRKSVKLSLELSPYSNGGHWWLRVHPNTRSELQNIREMLGLGKPNYGFHMTIGYANEKNKAHSEYLLKLLKKKQIYL